MTSWQERQNYWWALLGTTLLMTVVFYNIVQPFLISLVLAAITAALATPLRDRIEQAINVGRSIAALCAIGLLLLLVIVPLIGIVWLASQQANALFSSIAQFDFTAFEDPQKMPDWIPFREALIENWSTLLYEIGAVSEQLVSFTTQLLGDFATGTAGFILQVFVYAYACFSFLALREPIFATLLEYTSLPREVQDDLHRRITVISAATLKGTLAIGLAQGLLGGLGLWVVGLEGVAFWTVIMFVLSIIPAVGPMLVLGPVALFLIITGDVAFGIGLAVWGFAVVGTIDNVMRPMLVGSDAALPDILIMISTMGGLIVFGAPGLVLGPVCAGIFVALWDTLRATDVPTLDPPHTG